MMVDVYQNSGWDILLLLQIQNSKVKLCSFANIITYRDLLKEKF